MPMPGDHKETIMRINPVKAALRSGQVQVGTWLHTLAVPQVPQILATAGFDFVYIDMEHSAFSMQTVGSLCHAALDTGMVPLVRPSGPAPHLISRPVDNGAMGILMPHVDTRQDAEAAVRAVKFPPLGERGSQPPNVHTRFAKVNTAEYNAAANEQIMVMVQIESRRAVDNLDDILTVAGVDGAVIGRGDLSAELGVNGQRDHPEVLAAVESLIAACRRHDRFPGLLVQDVAEAGQWIERGIRMIAYASEVTILRDAAASAVARIRGAATEG
jgi:4-hydroxy-2-oxoheptanedioate aldolase